MPNFSVTIQRKNIKKIWNLLDVVFVVNFYFSVSGELPCIGLVKGCTDSPCHLFLYNKH